jgi:hypothetical protein
MFFDFFNVPYYLIIILQAVCVIHCVRKGNQSKWIWLIVFLPLIGGLVYIFSEMLTKRDLNVVQSNISTVVFPTARLKELERKLEFSNTFDNKVALADGYLAAGMTDKAVALYESSLVGVFSDNYYVLTKLIEAYTEQGRTDDILKVAAIARKSPEFNKSHAHVLYALALERAGRKADAEKEFLTMKGTYSNFEGRFNYAQFLGRDSRNQEAAEIYSEILEEASHMSRGEGRNNREWFRKAKEEKAKLAG